MRFIHLAAIIAMVIVILAAPLRAEWWYIAAKPGMEVIGKIWVLPGTVLNIPIDTRLQCLKLDKATGAIPVDMVSVITTEESQTVVDGKTVTVITVNLTKAKIAVGFAKQKYRFRKGKFEIKQVEIE